MSTNLAEYNNSWYKPGSPLKRSLWYFFNILFFKTSLFPFYRCKVFLLRLFGAKIGHGVLIKPSVNIKYPWFLEIGDNVWIGEKVWIDNLANVTIGNNVCLSQESMLLTGNHDYTRAAFDLMVQPIVLENGAWIGGEGDSLRRSCLQGSRCFDSRFGCYRRITAVGNLSWKSGSMGEATRV